MAVQLINSNTQSGARSIWTGEDLFLLTNSDDIDNLRISPALKMLIFGDGSPTRLLTVLTGSRVTVNNITHTDITGQLLKSPCMEIPEHYAHDIPRRAILALLESNEEGGKLLDSYRSGAEGVLNGEEKRINPVIIRRSVTLCNERCDVLGIGVSWWRESDLNATLPGEEKGKPIGGALMSNRLGVHRELIAVVRGKNSELEELLGNRRRDKGGTDRVDNDSTSREQSSSSSPSLSSSTTSTTLKDKNEDCNIKGGKDNNNNGDDDNDDDDLWGRFYVMWKEGKRFTVVYEVFSQRALKKWMH